MYTVLWNAELHKMQVVPRRYRNKPPFDEPHSDVDWTEFDDVERALEYLNNTYWPEFCTQEVYNP